MNATAPQPASPLGVFLSSDFDRIFSNVATPAWAPEADALDEPALHAAARSAIREVAAQSLGGNTDPSMRCCLVLGEAGLGKTHAILAELVRLSRDGVASPVVVQLAANIADDQVSQWLLRKIVDELSASYFRDGSNQTPLERIAARLWARVEPGMRNAMIRFVEDRSEGRLHAHAGNAARHIVRNFGRDWLKPTDEPVVAGVLLEAASEGYPFTSWLQGATNGSQFAGFELRPLSDEVARREALLSLARICRAVQAPLIVVADQIEATMQIGSTQLLARLVAFLIQLVEEGGCAVGVVLSALGDTYDQALRPALAGGFRSRIESGIKPVRLQPPSPATLRAMVDRRTRALFAAHGASADEATLAVIVPKALVSGVDGPRIVLDRIRSYRERCRVAGRFVAPQPTDDSTVTPEDDFPKLWADWCDNAVGGLHIFSDHERVDLFAWLVGAAAEELPLVGRPHLERTMIEGPHPVRVIDICFVNAAGDVAERWKVAYCNAPVSRGRLGQQILSFLGAASEAKPAVIAPAPLTGFDDSGKAIRPRSNIEKLVTGPALLRLLDGGGRLAPVIPRHWEQASLARRFVDAYVDRAGFADWRRRVRFATSVVDIGALATLLQPEGGAAGTPQEQHKSIAATAAPAAGKVRDAPQARDPRDTARLLIGRSLAMGGTAPVEPRLIYWSLDRDDQPALPNFGLLVSGDAGQGKTQVIKGLVADVARLDCPILIFDFKNDYSGDFAADNAFETLNLRDGLPFNPLRPAPQGPSGAQITPHIYEVVSIFGDALKLGPQQQALLRLALGRCFEGLGQDLNEWLPIDRIRAPSLTDAVEAARGAGAGNATTATLINKLGLLVGMPLLPGDANARMRFDELMSRRVILSFNELPNDDSLKQALAELILIQLQGYMLRGEQPRALRRLLVFDEAWRSAGSRRLIELAREGRAFGVGMIAGSQFADDLDEDLIGNLATKVNLYNSDAGRRGNVVKSILGQASGSKAKELADFMAVMKPFDAVMTNQQNLPWVAMRVVPYFERRAPAQPEAGSVRKVGRVG